MTMRDQRHDQLTVGAPVLAQDGEQLGKVKEVQGRYFKVDAPMQPDYWLPMDVVGSQSGGQVMLSLTGDRLGEYKVSNPNDMDGDRDAYAGDYRTGTISGATTTMGIDRHDDRIVDRDRGDREGIMRDDQIVRDDDIIRAGERERMRDTTRVDDEDSVVLHEERLRAAKRQVEAGEVRLQKDIIEEEQSVNVPVTREEVFIERRPVTDGSIDGEIGDDPTEIRVPVMAEQVEARKETVATEEVSVGKRAVQENVRVNDTVRREEVDVEGDVTVNGSEHAGARGQTLRADHDIDDGSLDETVRRAGDHDDIRRSETLRRADDLRRGDNTPLR